MQEKLFTLTFLITDGEGEIYKHARHENLTKEELDNLLFTLDIGDFGCTFEDIEYKEQ